MNAYDIETAELKLRAASKRRSIDKDCLGWKLSSKYYRLGIIHGDENDAYSRKGSCVVVNTPVLYSEGYGFDFRTGNQVS
jgi:hypothetical protein